MSQDQERIADLIDVLVEAQDVNQAGFYSMQEDHRRAARRAVVEAFDTAIRERDDARRAVTMLRDELERLHSNLNHTISLSVGCLCPTGRILAATASQAVNESEATG